MLDFLITNFFPDDAYYYFKIAKNIVAGLGSTFDGFNPANGYHPLWMVVILPIFRYLAQPIYAILAIELVFYTASAFVLYKIVSRYSNNFLLKASVVALWILNPFNFYQTFNGLETALSVLLISLFLLFAIRVSESNKNSDYILIGIIGGLMMLARLDNIFYFIAFLTWLFFIYRQEALKKILTVGITATVIVTPWLWWNISSFGAVIPYSASASTLVTHQLIAQDHGNSMAQKAKAVIYSTYNEAVRVVQQTGAPEMFLVFLGVFVGWLMFKKDQGADYFNRALKRPEVLMFFGFLAIFLVNSSVRWFARTWYFVFLNFFIAMFTVYFIEKINSDLPKKKIISVAIVVAVVCFYYIAWSKDLKDNMLGQREMLAAAQWSNDNLPKGSKIGVFNAGIQGYFSTNTVVNLDGLVNNNAYYAIKKQKLWDYIESEKINYIIDYDYVLNYRYKSFLGVDDVFDHLQDIKNIKLGSDTSRTSSGISVYKIIK